jgi:hypothetical protein
MSSFDHISPASGVNGCGTSHGSWLSQNASMPKSTIRFCTSTTVTPVSRSIASRLYRVISSRGAVRCGCDFDTPGISRSRFSM